MHTWVEWTKGRDGKVTRRYFDDPKDALPFAQRLYNQGYIAKIKRG